MARTIPPAPAPWPPTSIAFTIPRRVWLIYGAMRDKAVAEMAAILFPRARRVIVTAPAQARALRPETIRDLADHDSIEVAPNLAAALALAAELTPAMPSSSPVRCFWWARLARCCYNPPSVQL